MEKVKIIITVGIITIVAIILAMIIGDQVATQTAKTGTTETISTTTARDGTGIDFNYSVNLGPISQVPTGWRITDCPVQAVLLQNGSKTVTLTLTTDYTLSGTTGYLNIKNTTATRAAYSGFENNNSYIGYTYCASDYMPSDTGRTIMNLLVGLFIIAIFVAVVIYFTPIFKEIK